MTPAAWESGKESYPLLQSIRGKAGNRKLRLFACACCRRLYALAPEPRFKRQIELAERYADGDISEQQFISAFPAHEPHRQRPTVRTVTRHAMAALDWRNREQTRWGFDEATGDFVEQAWAPGEYAEHFTSRVCLHVLHAMALHELGPSHRPGADPERFRATMAAEDGRQCELLRDVFGNPFRLVALDPSWRTTTAVGLARQMYESRDFAAMPILADALEDAGCDSADVLAHCRGDGPHVRGCWVVDLVLGKS